MSAAFTSWTTLQPAFFPQNLVAPVSRFYFKELAKKHVLRSAYKPDTKIAITDPSRHWQVRRQGFPGSEGGIRWESRAGGVSGDADDGRDCADNDGGEGGVCERGGVSTDEGKECHFREFRVGRGMGG